jgi:hypothetical protein
VKVWTVLPAVVLLAAALAGCGAGATTGVAAAPVHHVPAACPTAAENSTQDTVPPTGFRVSWVLRCVEQVQTLAGRGKWTVLLTQRADTPAEDLLAQLRQPADPPAGICSAILVLRPYFALVDTAGNAVRPTIPTDGCGQPKQAVITALEALPFHTVSTTPLRQVESQTAVETGCSQQFKDTSAQARPGQGRLPWPTPPTSIRVCFYDHISGGAGPTGELQSGHTLTGADAAALMSALANTGPALACSAVPTRFAVLTDPQQPSWVVVELDGCQRLVFPDGTLGQLNPTVIRQLSG